MKLFFLFISILLFSCQDNNFQEGDCVQKPDESVIWKISQLKDGKATAVPSGANAPEMARDIQLNSSWIKTRCKD